MRLSTILVPLLPAISFAGQERTEQYALTASSSFRMIISRTETELGSVAVRILQEVTAEHLLENLGAFSEEQEQPNYRSVEVVVQASELIPNAGLQTRIRFFVLASTRASAGFTTQAQRQRSLNALVEYSFATQDRVELLLLRIRVKEAENRDNINTKASIQLQAIDTISVTASSLSSPTTAPVVGNTTTIPTEPSPISSRRLLSTLDLVLIAVASFILLGIIWILTVHYTDRGHFENQRMRALQQQRSHQQAEAMKQRRDEEKAHLCWHEGRSSSRQQQQQQITPTTNSTTSGGGGSLRDTATNSFPSLRRASIVPASSAFRINTALVLEGTSELQEQRQQQPPRPTTSAAADQVYYVTSGLTAEHSESYITPSEDSSSSNSSSLSHSTPSTGQQLSSSSSQITGTLGIAEPFDQNWFRRPLTPAKSTKTSSGKNGSSCSSDDGLAAVKENDDDDDADDVFQVGVDLAESQSSETDPHAMQEWLQSIHVVPLTPDKSGSPKPINALEVASLGHVSLEQSMVSSAIASSQGVQEGSNLSL